VKQKKLVKEYWEELSIEKRNNQKEVGGSKSGRLNMWSAIVMANGESLVQITNL